MLLLGLGFLDRITCIFALDVSAATTTATALRILNLLSTLGGAADGAQSGLSLLVLVLDLQALERVVEVGDLLGALLELSVAGLLGGVAGLAEGAGDP